MLKRNAYRTSRLATALIAALLWTGTSFAQQAAQSDAPEDWRTAEFLANQALSIVNADYAYARGLSGAGVALGLFGSGVLMSDSEFAGRGHLALQLGDPACVSRQGDRVLFGGTCFGSRGDQPAVAAIRDWLPDPMEVEYFPFTQASFDSTGTSQAALMVGARNGAGFHGVAFGSTLASARYSYDTLRLYDYPDPQEPESYTDIAGAEPGAAEIASLYGQLRDQQARAVFVAPAAPRDPGSDSLSELEALYGARRDYYDAYADGSIDGKMLTVVDMGPAYHRTPVISVLPSFRPDAEPYWLTVVNLSIASNGAPVYRGGLSNPCGATMDWCIAAPGIGVNSVHIGSDSGDLRYDADSGRYYVDIAPTSTSVGSSAPQDLAGAVATGALGLLFERFPYLTSTQVRDVMLTTAKDMGDSGVDEIYGWGLIDLRKAVDGPGLLRTDTEVAMDRPGVGVEIAEAGAWDDWSNDIGGPGRLIKSGPGWLRLSGDNSFGGATIESGVLEFGGDNALGADVRVEGGVLLVGGSIAGAVRIGPNGVLGGSGRIGGAVVGGTVAPGDSIGTLEVAGDYEQRAGSTYEVEFSSSGADRIDATGTASLLGGSVAPIWTGGSPVLDRTYRILSAAGGVSGEFDAIDAAGSGLPFAQFELTYLPDAVDMRVSRGAPFVSAARTVNQREVAGALDSLPNDSPLLRALLVTGWDAAAEAFDRLSGERHASAQALLVESSRSVREAALSRARSLDDGFLAQADDDARAGVWIKAMRDRASLDTDGNAASADAESTATFLGADYAFESGWRLGALGGLGRTDGEFSGRGEADIDSRTIGAYAGRRWGGFGLRAGLAYDRHRLDLRHVFRLSGFDDGVRAEYDGTTRQAFVEGGYRFGDGRWTAEPYLQYARIEAESDGFAESGGASALAGQTKPFEAGLATAGLRGQADLKGAGQVESWLSLRGGIGYRMADGTETGVADLRFAGSAPFRVRGLPIADEAALIELGVAARLSANSVLQLDYAGQFADEGETHRLEASLSIRF